jgi:hypothetical protein
MFATMRDIALSKGGDREVWNTPLAAKNGGKMVFSGRRRNWHGVCTYPGREYALDEWNIMSPNLSNVRDETIRSSCEGAKWGTIL